MRSSRACSSGSSALSLGFNTLHSQHTPVEHAESDRLDAIIVSMRHACTMVYVHGALQVLSRHLWHHVTMMMRPPGAVTLASSPTKRACARTLPCIQLTGL